MDTFIFYLLIPVSPCQLLLLFFGLIIYRKWLDGNIINLMTVAKFELTSQ